MELSEVIVEALSRAAKASAAQGEGNPEHVRAELEQLRDVLVSELKPPEENPADETTAADQT